MVTRATLFIHEVGTTLQFMIENVQIIIPSIWESTRDVAKAFDNHNDICKGKLLYK